MKKYYRNFYRGLMFYRLTLIYKKGEYNYDFDKYESERYNYCTIISRVNLKSKKVSKSSEPCLKIVLKYLI